MRAEEKKVLDACMDIIREINAKMDNMIAKVDEMSEEMRDFNDDLMKLNQYLRIILVLIAVSGAVILGMIGMLVFIVGHYR